MPHVDIFTPDETDSASDIYFPRIGRVLQVVITLIR